MLLFFLCFMILLKNFSFLRIKFLSIPSKSIKIVGLKSLQDKGVFSDD